MSEWGERIYKQGYEEGARESAVSTAEACILDGLPLERVSRYSGLPLEEVEVIAKGLSKKEA